MKKKLSFINGLSLKLFVSNKSILIILLYLLFQSFVNVFKTQNLDMTYVFLGLKYINVDLITTTASIISNLFILYPIVLLLNYYGNNIHTISLRYQSNIMSLVYNNIIVVSLLFSVLYFVITMILNWKSLGLTLLLVIFIKNIYISTFFNLLYLIHKKYSIIFEVVLFILPCLFGTNSLIYTLQAFDAYNGIIYLVLGNILIYMILKCLWRRLYEL